MGKKHTWQRWLAAVVAGLALFSVSATALADNGAGNGNGNGVVVTQYRAAYSDFFFGPVSCAGVHQTGKNFGLYGQDSWTCTSTTGNPLRNVLPGESLSLNTTGGWYSDYYAFAVTPGFVVFATGLTGTVSDDGLSYTAVANY